MYIFIAFEDGWKDSFAYYKMIILVRDGIVQIHTILPVSAQILAHMDEYNTTLELPLLI